MTMRGDPFGSKKPTKKVGNGEGLNLSQPTCYSEEMAQLEYEKANLLQQQTIHLARVHKLARRIYYWVVATFVLMLIGIFLHLVLTYSVSLKSGGR